MKEFCKSIASRIDKVIAMVRVAPFFRLTVYSSTDASIVLCTDENIYSDYTKNTQNDLLYVCTSVNQEQRRRDKRPARTINI